MHMRFGWHPLRKRYYAQVVMSSRVSGVQFQHLLKGPGRIGQAFLLKIGGPQISVGTEVPWGEGYSLQEMFLRLVEIRTRRCYQAQQQLGIGKARINRKRLRGSLSSLLPPLLLK